MRCSSSCAPRALRAPRASRTSTGIFAASALFLVVTACEPAPLPEDDLYVGANPLAQCVPNNDGVITEEEMPFVSGAQARIRVADGPINVDVVGTEKDGVVEWDFSRPDPEEQPLAFIGPIETDDQWFLDAFAERGATPIDVLAPLDPGATTLGPVLRGNGEISLWGAASADENPDEGRTLVVYDSPAPLYRFPLEVGARVTESVRASNATLLGLPVALDDTYDVEVTAIGTLRLPDLILDNTLRVTVRLERTLTVGDVRQVTHIFVHECLGEVARVVSEPAPLDETIPDAFDVASQMWRLSL